MKKIISVLLALAVVLCLTACGSFGDRKTAVSVVAAEYGPMTSYWWLELEQDFEEANPTVDLIVDVVSWNDIHTVVDSRIANGEAPDIVNLDVFADYQAQGLLLPVQEFSSPAVRNNMLPIFYAQSQVDDEVWALPIVASARALYYNEDLLTQARVQVPRTWSELTAAAQAIKDHFSGDILPLGVDMTTNEGHACFAYFTWNNGGGFLDDSGHWALNRDENVEALEYVVGLVSAGLTNSDPATETRYDLQELFASGKLAMMIGPNQIASYVSANQVPVPFGVAPIPAGDGKKSVYCGVVDRFLCFDNPYTPTEKAAISAFFDFFYEDSRYAGWVTMEDFLPVTASGTQLLSDADPDIQWWMDIVDQCQFSPVSAPEWAAVQRGVIQAEQLALQGGNVQQLLNDLQDRITKG